MNFQEKSFVFNINPIPLNRIILSFCKIYIISPVEISNMEGLKLD